LLNSTLFSPVDRNEIQRKAASVLAEEAKIAFDSSPKSGQPLPSAERGTGTAEPLSPSASTISLEEPTWWIAMAVRPALKPSTIWRKPSVGAEGGMTLCSVPRPTYQRFAASAASLTIPPFSKLAPPPSTNGPQLSWPPAPP